MATKPIKTDTTVRTGEILSPSDVANLPAIRGTKPTEPAMTGYAMATMGPRDLVDMLRDNAGTGVREFDLDGIKMPSGGAVFWEVPTLTGSPDPVKELECVILYWKDVRGYWAVPFEQSGGGTPPDCASVDNITGIGQPGGGCMTCPLSQFGSGEKDGKKTRGQACKQMRMLFIMRPDSIIPMRIAVPPTSLGVMRKFFLRMAGQQLRYTHAVVKLSLLQKSNKDGVKYAEITPGIARLLSAEECAKVDAISAGMLPIFDATKVTAGEHSAA